MANPISIEGYDLPTPSSYKWDLEDVSGKGAGRTEANVKMNKMRIGQLRGVTLGWTGLTTEQVSIVLQAFNPEYITATILDPLIGGNLTSEFYVGNRSAALFDARRGLWDGISFKIVQREDVSANA